MIISLFIFFNSCVFKDKTQLNFTADKTQQNLRSSLRSELAPGYVDILGLVFKKNKCLACHVAPLNRNNGFIDLTTYKSFLDSGMNKWDNIKLTSNVLYDELKTGSMPIDAPAVTELELELVGKYIAAGSPEFRVKIELESPKKPEQKPEPIPPKDISQVEVNFKNLDKYIIKKHNCTKCHNNKRSKGGVNLEGLEEMLSSRINPIEIINPLDSLLYTSVIVYDDWPADMPPLNRSNNTQLTQEEVEFVKKFVMSCEENSAGRITCP